jgi:hypothetical protein
MTGAGALRELNQDRLVRAMDGVASMRGVVIAKMIILMLWGLYLFIGLTQPTENGGRVTVSARCP